ncbi:MAG: tRNA lysidine(34) synthetase TilS, partial [Epsilonproteobacteria bacterium]|nr:tRNA lysidine(34) synthetase TilS [Campylobacterota bacterium]
MAELQNLCKLPRESLKLLKKGKNLLAFSGGVDSSALFHLLIAHNIPFDIAIVNYNTREQSLQEVKYAKELSKRYDTKLYIKDIRLKKSNFEHLARVARYDFFEEIISRFGYDNLITAHQLDDRVEWFLMQFTKGAGVVEMIGFDEIQKRENYTLLRPLLEYSKEDLLNFLKSNNIKYFIDQSNFDTKYKRNLFRDKFAKTLLDSYKNGIVKSFRYLNEDKKRLFANSNIKKIKELYIIKKDDDDLVNIRSIDTVLKRCGYILSKKQRDEIVKRKDVVISDKFAVVFTQKEIFISPYIKTKMAKSF